MSHIPKFGDASKSPVGDAASLAGDAASLAGDAASLAGDAASLAGDAASPAGDVIASPNCGICDTAIIFDHFLT